MEHIGIGRMMVKALEQNGAKVYVVGIDKDAVEKMAKEEAVSFRKKNLTLRKRHVGGTKTNIKILRYSDRPWC